MHIKEWGAILLWNRGRRKLTMTALLQWTPLREAVLFCYTTQLFLIGEAQWSKRSEVWYTISNTCKNPRKWFVVHSNRLKKYTSWKENEGCPEDNWIILPSLVEQMGAPETVSPVHEETSPERQVESESLQQSHTSISPWSSNPPALRWSTRLRRPPDRYRTVLASSTLILNLRPEDTLLEKGSDVATSDNGTIIVSRQ